MEGEQGTPFERRDITEKDDELVLTIHLTKTLPELTCLRSLTSTSSGFSMEAYDRPRFKSVVQF